MKILGTILAGGQSRRMEGREKSMLVLEGKSLLERAVGRLTPQVGDCIINANGDGSRFSDVDLPVVPDPIEGFAGPLAGVLAGMLWAKENGSFTHVVTAAADTPFFPTSLVRSLSDALQTTDGNSIALASTHGRLHPVFGLWPVALSDDLAAFLAKAETRKVLAFVDQHGSVEVPFDTDANGTGVDTFFNINTPEDMVKAESVISTNGQTA